MNKPDYKQIQMFQQGDKAAFETLLKIYGSDLINFIRRFIRIEDQADDIFQNVCLKIWLNKEQLSSPNNFKAWIYQITRREIYSLSRKRDWPVEIEIYSDWCERVINQSKRLKDDPRNSVFGRELCQILNEGFQFLDNQTKEIIVMRFVGGLKLREISEVLNLPHTTICYRLEKGTKILREHLLACGITFDDAL